MDADVAKGQVDSITYSFTAVTGTSSTAQKALVSTEQKLNEDVNNDDDTWDARYNIKAGETYRIVVTVDSADAAAHGELKVNLDFHRRTAF